MNQYIEQFKTLFSKLTRPQKIAIAGVVFFFLFAMLFLFLMRSRVTWVTLFDDLEESEAAAITQKIRDYGFEVKFEQSTVMIKKEERNEIRFRLASDNALPSSGGGYAKFFDGTNLMAIPNKVQRLNMRRGLEEELAKTLTFFQQVQRARVHIVLPEEHLWQEDQKPTTCSVILKLKPFARLDRKQVETMVSMVCSSVEGLEPKHLSIADENGNDLTAELGLKDADTPSSRKAKQMEFRKRVERDLEKKAMEILERPLGKGKAIVKVTADLNFDQIERSSTQYTPPVKGEESGVLESRKTEAELYEGKGPKPSGVPGTESNTNPSYQREENADGSKYNRSNAIENFKYNVMNEHHIPEGGVRKLSVAVMLDQDRDPETNKVRNEFTDEQIEMFKEQVSAAVGLSSERGDYISVSAFPFDKTDQLRMKEEMDRLEMREALKFWVPFALFVMIVFVLPSVYFLWSRYKERKERERRQLEERRKIAVKVEQLEPQISLEEQEQLEKQEKIKQAAAENPDQFASLLRVWLSESE